MRKRTGSFNGIYRIRNRTTDDHYIGSAAGVGGFDARWRAHRNALKRGNHENQHLQRAWIKYGEDAFEFEILMFCTPDECVKMEQFFIDCRQPEYNMCPVAGNSRGRRHSDETKAKISAAHQGKKHSSDAKMAMSEAKKHGRNPNAKLTPGNVREIRRLLGNGEKVSVIAQRYSVSQSLISNIKARRAWSYV